MLLVLLVAPPLVPAVLAQDDTNFLAEYRYAKQYLDDGSYDLAQEAFEPLARAAEGSNPYRQYASFYYAYAAYHAGDVQVAKSMLLQITQKYPTWKGMDNVRFWLARLYFEEGNATKGLEYCNQIENKRIVDEAQPMKSAFLAQVTDPAMVDSLYGLYPNDRGLAIAKAKYIMAQPVEQQDRKLLKQIVSRFKLNKREYNVVNEQASVKKDVYHVAVLLPFYINPNNPFPRTRKGFVVELYEGMQLAVEDLKNEAGIDVRLHAYDTRRDSATTAAILAQDELKQMDLIIGPLYAATTGLAQQFSLAHKINIVNPLSDNTDIIGNNPYSFLHKAGAAAKLEKAEALAQAAFTNKYCLVVYGESLRDSLMAYKYKHRIEAAGFTVTDMHKLERSATRSLYNKLTEPHYRIEDALKIADDSLGHVFVASTNPIVVASSISAVAARPDNIPMVGFTEWLDLRVVRYEQLERLDLFMLGTNYVDIYSEAYERFTTEYRKQYAYYPSKNACTGYDVATFTGKMLHQYGTYYQHALRNSPQVDVALSKGFDYRTSNDNRYLGIYRLEEAQPVEVTLADIEKQRKEAEENDE